LRSSFSLSPQNLGVPYSGPRKLDTHLFLPCSRNSVQHRHKPKFGLAYFWLENYPIFKQKLYCKFVFLCIAKNIRDFNVENSIIFSCVCALINQHHPHKCSKLFAMKKRKFIAFVNEQGRRLIKEKRRLIKKKSKEVIVINLNISFLCTFKSNFNDFFLLLFLFLI
jgi:hypothetical protein